LGREIRNEMWVFSDLGLPRYGEELTVKKGKVAEMGRYGVLRINSIGVGEGERET